MNQLSVPFAEKLDAPLAGLCNAGELAVSERIPVIVRCDRSQVSAVGDTIALVGGSVRHHLHLLGAVAAWLPIASVARVAEMGAVSALELEQNFIIA